MGGGLGVCWGLVGWYGWGFPAEESTARESFLPWQASASWRFSHLPLLKRHPDAGNTQMTPGFAGRVKGCC